MRVPILGELDERFFMHRLRSTSIGGMSATAVAAGFFFHELLAKHVIRWDLFAVVMTAGLVKIAVLIYYRLTD